MFTVTLISQIEYMCFRQPTSQVIVTSSGRTVKKRSQHLDDDPEQEVLKYILEYLICSEYLQKNSCFHSLIPKSQNCTKG